MDWDTYVQVMMKLGGLPLTEIPSFRDVAVVYGIPAAVRALVVRHRLDDREALVIQELAGRIPWSWRRRRRRNRETVAPTGR